MLYMPCSYVPSLILTTNRQELVQEPGQSYNFYPCGKTLELVITNYGSSHQNYILVVFYCEVLFHYKLLTSYLLYEFKLNFHVGL